MKAAAALLLILAGTEYHLQVAVRTAGRDITSGARVWVDGSRQRMELDPQPDMTRIYDVMISSDGGRTATLINLQNNTWYRRDELPAPPTLTGAALSNYFQLPMRTGEKLTDLHFTSGSEAAEQFLGHATAKRWLRVRYRITVDYFGAPVNGDVDATFAAWVADGLPPLAPPQLRLSGFADVDDAISRWAAALAGPVVKQETYVTRIIEGGRPFTEVSRYVVDQLEEKPVPASRFAMPAGLTHQLPVVSGPGVTDRSP